MSAADDGTDEGWIGRLGRLLGTREEDPHATLAARAAYDAARNSQDIALLDAAVSGMGTMRQGLEAWFAPRRFSLSVFAAFALAAVLLAASGLYGLASYAVSQRRREIGLRMALGASMSDVRRLVLGHAAGLAIAGIAAGIGITIVARPMARWILSETTMDPLAAVASAAVLFIVVLLAGALPAHRASRVDPTIALRGE